MEAWAALVWQQETSDDGCRTRPTPAYDVRLVLRIFVFWKDASGAWKIARHSFPDQRPAILVVQTLPYPARAQRAESDVPRAGLQLLVPFGAHRARRFDLVSPAAKGPTARLALRA